MSSKCSLTFDFVRRSVMDDESECRQHSFNHSCLEPGFEPPNEQLELAALRSIAVDRLAGSWLLVHCSGSIVGAAAQLQSR